MENNRTYCFFKESGVALVNTLIIVAASLLLIGGIYYLTGGGFKIATINKKFSSSQEAAAGGVQLATEALRLLINDYNNGAGTFTLSNNMGWWPANYGGAANAIFYCQQQAPPATLRAKTADGRYQIDMTVTCLGQKPVPGSGNAMIFPPPPSSGGGGGTAFYFYSITAQAQDMLDTQNLSIGKVQAVYRLTR